MTLIAWKSPVVTDTDEAKRLVALDDESVFAPSEDVARFYAELTERFPDGSGLWADGATGSDRVVFMSIRWSADDGTSMRSSRSHANMNSCSTTRRAVVPLSRRRGRGHALRAQRRRVHPRRTPRRDRIVPGDRGLEAVDPVLSWILVFVGGFVAVVAVLAHAATAQKSLRARTHRPR